MFNKYTIKGNNYEIGYQMGLIFKKSLNDNINKFVELLKNDDLANSVDKTIENIKQQLPRCYDELFGKASAANVDFRALVLMHSPELIEKLDGCTTAIYKKGEQVLFSHNEDDLEYTHDDVALVKYINEDDSWIVALAEYNKLIGACFGYTSNGIIFSCNYIYHYSVNIDFLSRYIVIRDVIEGKDIDDCLARLNKHPSASPFSFNVLQKDNLRVLNVENDYNNHYITNIDSKFARSNHFLNVENHKTSLSSDNRLKNATDRLALLNEDCTIEQLIDVLALENSNYVDCILKDPQKFVGQNVSITIANFAYDSKDDKIIINDYFDHTKLVMNYEEF